MSVKSASYFHESVVWVLDSNIVSCFPYIKSILRCSYNIFSPKQIAKNPNEATTLECIVILAKDVAMIGFVYSVITINLPVAACYGIALVAFYFIAQDLRQKEHFKEIVGNLSETKNKLEYEAEKISTERKKLEEANEKLASLNIQLEKTVEKLHKDLSTEITKLQKATAKIDELSNIVTTSNLTLESIQKLKQVEAKANKDAAEATKKLQAITEFLDKIRNGFEQERKSLHEEIQRLKEDIDRKQRQQ